MTKEQQVSGEISEMSLDDAILALSRLGLHAEQRAWKGFDRDSMERLHEKGLISDPVGKARSVWFTDEGLEKSEQLLRQLFGEPSDPP